MAIHYVRFESEGRQGWGVLEADAVERYSGHLFQAHQSTNDRIPLANCRLLPPVSPGKIICVGLNYRSHLGGRKLPPHPELFYKPPSSLIGPGDEIVLPRDSTDVHFEGELVLVIGKRTRNADREQAAGAIFGVSCGNDVSERNWQRGEGKDLQWWRAKGCDTFAPLGPAIVTGVDYGKLTLETRVNGKLAQDGSTSELVHDGPSIVSWASQWITLEPGDLIYTGTPGETFALKPGDVVEVKIEEVGTLVNPVY